MNAPRLHIFCRWPVPGEAKTRLIPRFGAEGAAAIYAKLLQHTVAVARASGLPFELRVTGAEPDVFRSAFGEDIAVTPQGDGDLSDKLARVSPPAIVIGSDCPGLTEHHLWAASDTLAREQAVIGPASDGGYYLIGFAQDARFAFENIAWSTASVFEETLARFSERDIRTGILPELADVDEPADLDDWPDFLP